MKEPDKIDDVTICSMFLAQFYTRTLNQTHPKQGLKSTKKYEERWNLSYPLDVKRKTKRRFERRLASKSRALI